MGSVLASRLGGMEQHIGRSGTEALHTPEACDVLGKLSEAHPGPVQWDTWR